MSEIVPSSIFDIIKAPKLPLPKLADSILQLSDHFVNNPDDLTPWTEKFCQEAYRYYYLPLNYLRCFNVIQRGQLVNFFKDVETSVDWGSGPGTASIALSLLLGSQIKKQILIDQSDIVLKVFSDLHSHLKNKEITDKLSLKNLTVDPKKSLLIFSYSLTEMKSLPDGYEQFESIMILEPSTQDDGRKLLQTREKLIAQGYYIWAPCVHQQSCPLQNQSKTDWCHDRFHVKAPDWFLKMEPFLPFRNRTITTSYLLAKKTAPAAEIKNFARITGDSLDEKGKTRQLVCRNTDREFLAWMHKSITVQTIPRGELVTLPNEIEKKSNELRLSHPVEIKKIAKKP